MRTIKTTIGLFLLCVLALSGCLQTQIRYITKDGEVCQNNDWQSDNMVITVQSNGVPIPIRPLFDGHVMGIMCHGKTGRTFKDSISAGETLRVANTIVSSVTAVAGPYVARPQQPAYQKSNGYYFIFGGSAVSGNPFYSDTGWTAAYVYSKADFPDVSEAEWARLAREYREKEAAAYAAKQAALRRGAEEEIAAEHAAFKKGAYEEGLRAGKEAAREEMKKCGFRGC